MFDTMYLDLRHEAPPPIGLIDWPSKPGHPLPNGAIILADWELRRYDHQRISLVFALNPGHVQPFVSWIRMISTDAPLATGGFHVVDTTDSGDYCTNLEDAWTKFQARFEERQDALEGKERIANEHA